MTVLVCVRSCVFVSLCWHAQELEEARAARAEVQGEVTGLQQEVEDGARLHSKARASQNELAMQLQGAQSTISALGKVCMCVHVCVHLCAICVCVSLDVVVVCACTST
jgi:hypothetical protein